MLTTLVLWSPENNGRILSMLSLVATPIGHLEDLSLRAARTLEAADIIACEDTRTTRKLVTLTQLQVRAKYLPYHDHNGARMRPVLIRALQEGKSVALVSDAGTPLVSDPGFKLVAACHEAGISVTSIPGPSAPIVGLSLAGLPSDKFVFQGFVPSATGAARRSISASVPLEMTQIWFESAKRLPATLQMMAELYGDRLAVVARELTKLHEEVRRAPLRELAESYAASGPPKGEIVLLIAGPDKNAAAADADDINALLSAALKRGTLKDAVQEVATITGQSRKSVYQQALALRQDT